MARAAVYAADDLEIGLVSEEARPSLETAGVDMVRVETAGDEDDVAFRYLEEEDLPALRALQVDLFPVRYNDAFYSRLFAPGYFTLVGVVRTTAEAQPAEGACGAAGADSCAGGGGASAASAVAAADAGAGAADAAGAGVADGANGAATLGAFGEAVVAVASARIDADWRVAYIMTLGVDRRYRRRGLGKRTLRLCLEALCERTSCRLAQLHVKTLNESAVAFYRNLGWVVDESEGRRGICRCHYTIHGVQYDALALKLDLAEMRREAALAAGRRESSTAESIAAIYNWGASVCSIL